MKQPKNQYCRYCANALDYNGERTRKGANL